MSRLITFTYNAILATGLLILLPIFLVKKKYRYSLKKKLGMSFPDIDKGDHNLIWIHAVSVGETKAVATLAKKIRTETPETLIILSTITQTGHAEGKRSIPFADFHVFLPFDLSWIIRPIIKRARPDVVILCETDFWPNFLKYSKDVGAKIVVVNGKISEKSSAKLQNWKFFTKTLFSNIDLFCLQNKVYQERFKTLGIDEKKLYITGNLKFDMEPKRIASENKSKNETIFVAGSTHDPEEKLILSVFKEIWKEYPNVKLFLVPRHPERFGAVSRIIREFEIPFSYYDENTKTTQLILVNEMGVLNTCYNKADVAIVCGSFTEKVGGHNILEPLWYGVPVIFGPYMYQQPGLGELVIEAGAGIQTGHERLKKTILMLINDPVKRNELGQSGKKLVESLKGATNRTWKKISELVPCVKS